MSLKIKQIVDVIYKKKQPKINRVNDENINTESYKIYKCDLEKACLSFHKKIDVLNMGCGTERYFHYLKKVSKLVGLDKSKDMLQQAKHHILLLHQR